MIAIFHMLKFGIKNFFTLAMTIFFSGVAFFILFVSFYFINQIDWSEEIIIFESSMTNIEL